MSDGVVWLCVSLQLEDAKEQLSVKEYGISVTTMEDVFLKVASDQEAKDAANLRRVVAETVIASPHSEEHEQEEQRLLQSVPTFDSFANESTSANLGFNTSGFRPSVPVSRSSQCTRVLDVIVSSGCTPCLLLCVLYNLFWKWGWGWVRGYKYLAVLSCCFCSGFGSSSRC
jgi:hypothetical protein